MKISKAEEIAEQLIASSEGLKFGSVSVTAKFHGGNLASISYSKTEQTLEKVKENDEESES